MEKNIKSNDQEQSVESGKNTSYVKVMLIFAAAMTVLLVGLNYLFNHLF